MNRQECDIMNALLTQPFVNQRILSETSGHSLGMVNRSLKSLIAGGYLTKDMEPTEKAFHELGTRTPQRAVILAAGLGMRMVPINALAPKGLLEINGEPLVERLIKQLHDVGVKDITIVIGFMKERYEYLMDEYGVTLVVNSDYAGKNNLHSLSLTAGRLDRAYVIPCDIWCKENPFNRREMYSWYMVSDGTDNESDVRVNRKQEIVAASEQGGGNAMIGIAYLREGEAKTVRQRIRQMAADPKHDGAFWEAALYSHGKMIVPARVVPASQVIEINTYEQLREVDSGSNHLKSKTLDVIAKALCCKTEDIINIAVLKKGMTNRSFLFTEAGQKYIMRIPGEGTEQLINRGEEALVYKAISGLGLCDDPIYINPLNGYKITKFLEGVWVCDADSEADVRACMAKLKAFHAMKLQVAHTFDLFSQIDYYEKLWDGAPSMYRDYQKTKENVLSLKKYIDAQPRDWCLTHIDAVADNFLFYTGPDGKTSLQLTDWEYAGMQDPHVDLAMFIVYSLYHKSQADRLIDLYFEDGCAPATRAKIYCYVAACGLLWSNWCEYKRKLGVEFGEYSLCQYRYGKDYYRYAKEQIESGVGE